MKIIAWNCNMKFRDKIDKVLNLSPQLAIISECEQIEKLKESAYFSQIRSSVWYGDNVHKGVGVFSFSDMELHLAAWHNTDFKYVIPIHVKSKDESWLLFAIWACNPKTGKYSYIEQVYQAMLYYSDYISQTDTLIIGDFNSNAIWDKNHSRYGSHSMLVNLLESKNIESSYHSFFKQKHGMETTPTLYMYRHIDKPYHIDYCFLSKSLRCRLKEFRIGQTELYLQHSDHMSIILELE